MNKLITLLAFTFSACAAAPVAQPTMVPKPIALAWDLKHTDAAKWSATLLLELDKAKLAQIEPSDAGDYCPNYKKISQENRRIFWANLFAIIAKYESSYNPKSSSVDVGVVGNKDTYSVGLYQMSVVDQKNYRFKLGFMTDWVHFDVYGRTVECRLCEAAYKLILPWEGPNSTPTIERRG